MLDLGHHYCGGCGGWEHCYWRDRKYLCKHCLERLDEKAFYTRAIRDAFAEIGFDDVTGYGGKR